ncbi:MAG: AMP-binding protein [Rhizomicrobium sp.]
MTAHASTVSKSPGDHDSQIAPSPPVAVPHSPLDPNAAARNLLAATRDVAVMLRPHRRLTLRVGLDSALDRDLGFDSLGRVELLLRLERVFHIRLPEALLSEAETPRDLLEAVLNTAAGGQAQHRAEIASLALEAVEVTPQAAQTLIDVLEWHVRAHPERPHILLDDGARTTATISYRKLRDSAAAVGAGLQAAGLKPGQTVAIMLPTSEEFFFAFFGVLYAGGVPVPIYPPFRPAQLEEHLRRQAGILTNARATVLITRPSWRAIAHLLTGQVTGLKSVESVESLARPNNPTRPYPADVQVIALIQYTSGSTGDPKGVVLSHANLLANIRAMGEALGASASDIFVSWLPLYHDMGLIGAWLGSLYYAAPVAILSPLHFLARPEDWLWAIHRYRATLSAAPNFAFELCLRKIDDADIAELDLGSLRMVVNGAEAVSPATLRNFTSRFGRYGMRETAPAPVYGLAECAVGLAFPPPSRVPIIDRVERRALTERGEAAPATADEPTALEFVACGLALSGHQIRILDPVGRELGDRREGRLQFRGPSATAGYFRNPTKTKELFVDGWLDSGDLAYTVSGDVFITGRSKDMIKRAGRNIYPHEIEEAVGNIPGVRKGCVVAFGVPDPRTGTERVVIVAETHEIDPGKRAQIRHTADEIVTTILEAPADDVMLAPPHTVLKTSSGKIRRAACRALYEAGQMRGAHPPIWRQIVRLRASALREQFLRGREVAWTHIYAGYWWGMLGFLAGLVWPLVILLPRRTQQWRVIRAASSLFLPLTATPLKVSGVEHIPPGAAVLVVNHSSYFDNVVLGALLPRPAIFVVKAELVKKFFARVFLRRIGAIFVERMDVEKGAEAAQKAAHLLRTGELIVFFPEGTLTRMPGLLAFRTGPFLAAAEAGVPIIPVAIRGTRSILRGDQWFPRQGRVEVTVAAPILPEGPDWSAAVTARDAARAEILHLVGEPDLAEEEVIF